MKKKCVGCGKQIPSVALDCVFCRARQPLLADGEQPAVDPSERASLHATDATLVGLKFSDMEAAMKAAQAQAAGPAAEVAPAAAEAGHSNGDAYPSQAKLTAAMPAVVVPVGTPTAETPTVETQVVERTAEPEATPAPDREAAPSPLDDRPFGSLGRTVMGIGGAVLIALFFLPWHGLSSWQLLETLSGADFVRQIFYLTGGVVLLATAMLPLPFAFRAAIGAAVAATPVVLGAGGVLEGWRGVVAGLAILGLPATHLLRAQAKSSAAARILVAAAVAAVAILYLVPVSSVVPIASVFKMIGSGQVGPAVIGLFILIPLVFAGLSLLGLLGRDLTDVGVLLSVLSLLWAPVVVALRGLIVDDGTQLYVALAILWASATSALSLAQLLSLAARSSAA